MPKTKMSKSATRRVARQTKKISRLKSKGKTKRAARVAVRQSKIKKTGKTGAGRAITKIKKTAEKVAKSNVGKALGIGSKLYKGNVKGALSQLKNTKWNKRRKTKKA